MVNIWDEALNMEGNYCSRSKGDWGDSKGSRHELEEGEIDEEDEDIYVLAEFDRREKIIVNTNMEDRIVKQDIDERFPFIINCTSNDRQVILPNMTHAMSIPKSGNRAKQPHVYDRDERHQRQPVKPRTHRGNRFAPNVRNHVNRPHMSGYSLRRQNLLRSIHRRSRAAAAYDSRNNRSYDDLLAEYKNIMSKLKDLNEEKCKSTDDDSKERSYGDKENRDYRRHSSSRLFNSEKRYENSRHLEKSSKDSQSPYLAVEESRNDQAKDEDDDAEMLRNLALASKFKCKSDSKIATSAANEQLTPSSESVVQEKTDDSSNKSFATGLDVDEDEDLLRAQLLSSITLKQLDKSSAVNNLNIAGEIVSVKSAESSIDEKPLVELDNSAIFKLPVHQPVVINLKDDSDSEPEPETETKNNIRNKTASIDMIDEFLRSVRSGLPDVSNLDSKPSTPPSIYRENESQEYQKLKAVIENRERSKNVKLVKKNDALDKQKTRQASLKLAEEKCLKSKNLLAVQTAELSKLKIKVTMHEKEFKLTVQKICNIEKQLANAKKLEASQKRQVAELNAKKLQLELQVKASRIETLELQKTCLTIGTAVVGELYKLPGTVAVAKRTPVVFSVIDKKAKIPVKKARSQLSSNVNGPSVSKRMMDLGELKIKYQQIVSRIADLRKQTLKASMNKPPVSAATSKTVSITSSTSTSVPKQLTPAVSQSVKRVRRQSLTKKAKKARLSESEPVTTKAESFKNPSNSVLSPSNAISSIEVEEEKLDGDFCFDVDSVFEFNQLFTNNTLILEMTEPLSSKAAMTNEIIPEAFLPYRSPLLSFRAYRFSPYFRTKSNQSLTWATYRHSINPKVHICRYDLTGKCNDDKCKWQHAANYIVSHEQCLKDLLSYAPQMVEESSDTKESGKLVNKQDAYVASLMKCNQERKMTQDELCVLLVAKINEHLNKVPPHFITFEDRRKRFSKTSLVVEEMNQFVFDIKIKDEEREGLKRRINTESDPDGICDESDVRYFECQNQNNEDALDEATCISQAKAKINTIGCSPAFCLDSALNTLVKALEKNTKSSILWSFYLSLYAKRQDCSDLMTLFDQAVRLAPSYEIYWQYLQGCKEYSEKVKLIEKILSFLIEAKANVEEHSHEIFEIVLYWIKLNLLTGHLDRAVNILEETLHKTSAKLIVAVCKVFEKLTANDRCLLWLCYISLKVFHSLPESLFSSENSGLGKVVSKSIFILPWKSNAKGNLKEAEILDLFTVALSDCADESQTHEENARLCLPLYKNLIALKMNKHRPQTVDACKEMVSLTSCDDALLIQACTYYHLGNFERLRKMLNLVLSEKSVTPVLYSFAIGFELKTQNVSGSLTLCLKCLSSLYNQTFDDTVDIDALFRNLLKLPIENKPLNSSYPSPPKTISNIAHVWLIYCMFLSTQEKFSEVQNVFETAIFRIANRQDLEMLWLHYLDTCFQQPVTLSKLMVLINRCLNSVPCKVTLPGSGGDITHISYAFFNLVLDKYMSCLDSEVQIQIMERFVNYMPNNSKLTLRLLNLYLKRGEFHLAWKMCCSQLERTSRNLELWKIAVRLAYKSRSLNEVRSILRHSTKALPYSQILWKKLVEFETSQNEPQKAKEVVAECSKFGVKINL